MPSHRPLIPDEDEPGGGGGGGGGGGASLDDAIKARCAALTGMKQFSYWSDAFLQGMQWNNYAGSSSAWSDLAAGDLFANSDVPSGVAYVRTNGAVGHAAIQTIGTTHPSWLGLVTDHNPAYMFARIMLAPTGGGIDGWNRTQNAFVVGFKDATNFGIYGVGIRVGGSYFGAASGADTGGAAIADEVNSSVLQDVGVWHDLEIYRTVADPTKWWCVVDGGTPFECTSVFPDGTGALPHGTAPYSMPAITVYDATGGSNQAAVNIDHFACAAVRNRAEISAPVPDVTPHRPLTVDDGSTLGLTLLAAADAAAARTDLGIVPFVPSGTGHAAGLVPDPGATAGATKYLREDGTWNAPTGGASTAYVDAGDAAAIAAAEAVAANATNLTSGTVPAARLAAFVASGASHAIGAAPDPGASAGTARFLREDSSWQTPAIGLRATKAARAAALLGVSAASLAEAFSHWGPGEAASSGNGSTNGWYGAPNTSLSTERGGVLSVDTGTGAGAQTILNSLYMGVAWFQRGDTGKGYFAQKIKITTGVSAQTVIYFAITGAESAFSVGIFGGHSATQLAFAYDGNAAGGGSSFVDLCALDTAWHNVEVYWIGDGKVSVTIDGGAPTTVTLATPPISSMHLLYLAQNGSDAASRRGDQDWFFCATPEA